MSTPAPSPRPSQAHAQAAMQAQVPAPASPGTLLAQVPVFVNLGVAGFCDALAAAGYEVVAVAWSPPAGGDPALADLLDELL